MRRFRCGKAWEGVKVAGKDKPSGRHYWLIAKRGVNMPEILGMGLAKLEYLPIFSFGEEAEMYLKLSGLEDGWEARETESGELLSMLFGDLHGVERVALDPLPEFSADGMTSLVSMSRKRFIDNLLPLGGRHWWRVRGKDGEGQILD